MGTSDQAMVSATQTAKRPRRMRTNEEKRRIVEETLVPGISLASVASKHSINANLLFSWRRLHRRGLLEQSREPASLVPVTITAAVVDVPDQPGSRQSRGARRVTTQGQAGSVAIELPSGVVLRARLGGLSDAGGSAECIARWMISPPAGVRVWLAAGATA